MALAQKESKGKQCLPTNDAGGRGNQLQVVAHGRKHVEQVVAEHVAVYCSVNTWSFDFDESINGCDTAKLFIFVLSTGKMVGRRRGEDVRVLREKK